MLGVSVCRRWIVRNHKNEFAYIRGIVSVRYGDFSWEPPSEQRKGHDGAVRQAQPFYNRSEAAELRDRSKPPRTAIEKQFKFADEDGLSPYDPRFGPLVEQYSTPHRRARMTLFALFSRDKERTKQEMRWIADKHLFDAERNKRRTMTKLMEERIVEFKLAHQSVNKAFLTWLLGPCYTREAANLELKWLREHVQLSMSDADVPTQQAKLEELCRRRHEGVPLQHILGTAYFGDIELKCDKNVLIPRQDTADLVMHLLERLKNGDSPLPRKLRVLDLCCGSGCMGLLMAHSFPFTETKARGHEALEICSIDNSSAAITLARENRDMVLRAASDCTTTDKQQSLDSLSGMKFLQANVLAEDIVETITRAFGDESFHIIVANPPYIRADRVEDDVSYSVRMFEPEDALVPHIDGKSGLEQSDAFYKNIMDIARALGVQIVLLEVGTAAQGERQEHLFNKIDSKTPVPQRARNQEWARPRFKFRKTRHDVSDNRHLQSIKHGTRGRAIYSYRLNAAGWVGPSKPVRDKNRVHYAQ